ncbi:hypothetical protein ASPZODRAFT_14068 [Penicilliopsis zonata CBS 506.65]|uniref:BZIP domain-containing protein n=1 Tax=Penicilliopsis zonata CBS 506.65 TaxID=1073090 RepID=A0A1L9SQB2_9EURO|nr:hypothetical protein ASPZODRAFT_14068 [Penicilliopsis zonata CBS 506.65]OJJ49348.1 hypothetical protein ASPZODRAFT_14068 [Penicilliopsis zonata CBS 506.65]
MSPGLGYSSESPVPGPLNFSIASRRSSSSPNTILPFDVTSFTTDNHQQSWLPTPLAPQPSAQNSINSNKNNNDSNKTSPHEDFVLYPPVPSPRPQLRPRDSRAPPASAHRPSPAFRHPFLVPQSSSSSRRHSLALQRHLQQQFAGSPAQVLAPSTRRLTQSTGLSLSPSYRSTLPGRKHVQRLYAASAPSRSPHPSRPPVPLFNNISGVPPQIQNLALHHRNMSTPNFAQDFFDLSNHFGDDFENTEPTMLSTQNLPGIDPMAPMPSGTVSPKDLFMDSSAPPSTSFTDLSTPSFESPGYFSQDTSPMFASDLELASGHEEWESLFPVSDAFDATALELVTAMAAQQEQQPKAPVAMPPPSSPIIRSSTSPAPSPGPGRVTKHSTMNARQRKPLPPIKVNNADPVAVKRARNTEAARKSRARKLERQDEMERRIAELEKSLEESQRREQYWKALAQSKA